MLHLPETRRLRAVGNTIFFPLLPVLRCSGLNSLFTFNLSAFTPSNSPLGCDAQLIPCSNVSAFSKQVTIVAWGVRPQVLILRTRKSCAWVFLGLDFTFELTDSYLVTLSLRILYFDCISPISGPR